MEREWEERVRRAVARYRDGEARLPEEQDERQRQLTRLGNAAWAAGLSLLALERREEAAGWLRRAAERYRESWPLAPPESWGRPIAAMKASLLAGDREGAREDARACLAAGAAGSASPIGRYAAALAHLVLGEDEAARGLAATLLREEGFPRPAATALAALAGGDAGGYAEAARSLLADFERREAFLEDVPVADTVLVLQLLARERGSEAELASPLLLAVPAETG
ncbi:MAG TPA: hypothetical protein VNJ46_09205 [Gaiellaceae bacterium]|nr:hypothetical protein [Gaiellaceae bacterium]